MSVTEKKMVPLARATTFCVIVLTNVFATETYARSDQATAYVHIEIAKRYIGGGGGSGALFYKGHHRYRLLLRGLKLDNIGRDVDLVGKAIKLKTPADIKGTYYAENGGSAIVGGARVARIQNEKGAILEVHAQALSPDSPLNLSGMTISGRDF
jgi:hypothetical protein